MSCFHARITHCAAPKPRLQSLRPWQRPLPPLAPTALLLCPSVAIQLDLMLSFRTDSCMRATALLPSDLRSHRADEYEAHGSCHDEPSAVVRWHACLEPCHCHDIAVSRCPGVNAVSTPRLARCAAISLLAAALPTVFLLSKLCGAAVVSSTLCWRLAEERTRSAGCSVSRPNRTTLFPPSLCLSLV